MRPPRIHIATCLVSIALIAGVLGLGRLILMLPPPADFACAVGAVFLAFILYITVTMVYALWH